MDYKPGDKLRTTYNPSKENQDILGHIYKRYQAMKNARVHPWYGPLENLWISWDKRYESYRPPKDENWQSNIVPPFTTTVVEKMMAEIVKQVLMPNVSERGDEDKIAAKLTNDAIKYTWDIGDGDLELIKALKQALIRGKTIWQEYYYRSARKVKYLTNFDFEKKIMEYEEKEHLDFDDVYGETVPLEDFFIDEAAESINRGPRQANDCIRRYVMSKESFESQYKGSVWDKWGHTKYVRCGAPKEFYEHYNPIQNYENSVELLMYWSKVPDRLAILANDVLIYEGPNPYNHKRLPFAEGTDLKRVRGFYGIGEPELLDSIQDELITIRRMRLDREHLNIFKTFIVPDRDTDITDEDDNFVAPNSLRHSSDPSSIKVVDQGQSNPAAYQEEELLKDDGRKVTGMEAPASSSTATEAAIFREVTMKALEMKIWLFSIELLKDIARLRASNITQFWTVPKATRILDGKRVEEYRRLKLKGVSYEITKDGKDIIEKKIKGNSFFTVSPDLIQPVWGAFDFEYGAEPSLPISKSLKQSKMVEFMNSAPAVTAIEQGYWDAGKVADALAEEHDYDPTRFQSNPGMGNEEEEQPVVTQEQIVRLAEDEFKEMLKGVAVRPTPFVPFAHTQIHLSQMDSQAFKEAVSKDPTVGEYMSAHILGEVKAQNMRGEGQSALDSKGMLGGAPANSVGAGVEQSAAKSVNPNMMVGAENVPNMRVPNAQNLLG